jgi:AraC-like DNA-binding protein
MVGPAPGDIAECIKVLGFPIQFGARRNHLVFDVTMLTQRIPQTVQRLFDTLKSVGERELAEVERKADIVATVRHALIETFGTDKPFDLETIAETVSMSARSLQWRLGQHETTYERLLTEARRDVAERMLLESQAPMTEIAGHLRFSELSAFTRAAHRWFGMSPTEYRRKLRTAGKGDGGASAA